MDTYSSLHKPIFKDQIETPSLLIDISIMEDNIFRMAKFFIDKHAKLRPHVKTHKTPIIAHKQLSAGSVVGITAAKLSEAEVMVSGGIKKILIANQIVDPAKIARLAGLSHHAEIIVAVDSPDNIKLLDQAAEYFKTKINVLIEVNVGLNRCGVEAGQPALDLANEILKLNHIKLRGLMGYEGHAVLRPNTSERNVLAQKAMEKLVSTSNLLRRSGIPIEIVSGGGTGTYNISGIFPGIDEIQAGSYPFMDSMYLETGVDFRQSLTLYATVISKPNQEKAILDSGLKSITGDHGFPIVKDHPDWRITDLHEEHSILEIPGGDRLLKPGDKIELIPSHVCTTVNLHDYYYGLRDDRVEAIWKIQARGHFR